MNTNKSNCRRSFLKKCATLTAGATVIGSGMKLMANPTDDWDHIAYCGAKCDNSCSWFKSNQCPGCKSIAYDCTVQICAERKKIPTCAHCDELETCNKQFWTDNPESYENIKELKASLNVTSIKKNAVSGQDILIFPNPAKDYLKIQNQQNSIFNYELVNINGQILKKGTIEERELTINISDFKSGSYLFKLVRNKNVLQTQKILKI